jgi:carbon monoxide dehydrogenase subunit G
MTLMTLDTGVTRRLIAAALLCMTVWFWAPALHANSDPTHTKVNFRREYMIYQPTENVLAVLRDYKRYAMLFPDIDKTTVHLSNKIHTIVRFDVRLLRRDFGALLEFTERSWSNVTLIKAKPIRLYKMSRLDGTMKVYNLGPKKTKIMVDANIKPKAYLPEFFIDRMVEKTFNNAIKRLRHFAWQRKAVPFQSDS